MNAWEGLAASPWLGEWARYMAAQAWQSALLLALLLPPYLLWRRRSPARACALLCLVLAKLALPPGLHSAASLAHWLGEWRRRNFPDTVPAGYEGAAWRWSGMDVPDLGEVPGPAAALSRPGRRGRPSPLPALFALWSAGAVGAAGLWWGRNRAWSRRLRAARPVEDPVVLSLLRECEASAGVRKPLPLRALPGLAGPALSGLFRPIIVVPPASLALGTRLRPIFLHELAHHRRRDLWVDALQNALLVPWFFHPGLWLANALIRRERERACDDWVLAVHGDGRDYAESIVAALKAAPAGPAAMGALRILERKGALKARLRRILAPRRLSPRLGITGFLVVALAGAVALPMRMAATGNTPTEAGKGKAPMGAGRGDAMLEQARRAVAAGDVEGVKRILDPHPELMSQELWPGRRLLEYCAEFIVWYNPKHLEIARYLLDHGAPHDIVLAARVGALDYVKKALAADPAALGAKDFRGRTALQRAVLVNGYFQPGLEVGDYLIARGAKVDIHTAAHLSRTRDVEALLAEHPELVHALYTDKAEPSSQPLHWAVRPPGKHNPEAVKTVEALIRHGADARAVDKDGWTPLHYCAEWDNFTDIAQVLLDHGADINATVAQDSSHRNQDSGWTPLDYAVDRKRAGMVRFLVSKGANLGRVPTERLEAILRPDMWGALRSGDLGALQRSLQEDPSQLEARNGNGATPLYEASWRGHTELVRYLLDKGADPDAKAAGPRWVPLIGAAENGRLEVVDLLLAHKAKADAANDRGLTALDFALAKGHAEVAERLRKAGAPRGKPGVDPVHASLPGLRASEGWNTMVSCLADCARYLGLPHDYAWMMGATGQAFVMNMPADGNAAGIIGWDYRPSLGLAANLGLKVEGMAAARDGDPFYARTRGVTPAGAGGFRAKQGEAHDRVRAALAQGQPCFAFQMGTPEFLLIAGADDQGYYPLGMEWNGKKRLDLEGMAAKFGYLDLRTARAAPAADDRTTVREGLAFALRFARHPGALAAPGNATGLAAYDAWIAALESAAIGDFDQSYHAAIWADARKQAAAFLEEARRRVPGHEAAFAAAAGHYRAAAAALGEVTRLFPFPAKAAVKDADKRVAAIARLREARGAEEAGLAELEGLVRALGG